MITLGNLSTLAWYKESLGKPKDSGKYLLMLDDGDFTVDCCYVPGSQWLTLRTVVRWAKLSDL